MNNLLSKITIIIPTYNRPKHLKRSLDYFGRTGLKVIIADGSGKRFDGEIPANISYIYDNESLLARRWLNSLKMVTTPYVVICADDDFLSINGLEVCLSFLNGHTDYASVQGLAVSFDIDYRNNIAVTILNRKMLDHHIDGSTARERLNQIFNEYIYQIYSVYRTANLQLVYETCIDQKNPNYTEIAATIIPTIFGKHKVVPVFYAARENIIGSANSTYEVPRFDILKPEGLIEYEQWRDKIAGILSKAEGVTLNSALIFVEDVFRQYNEWDFRAFPNRRPLDGSGGKQPLSLTVKSSIKKLIPSSLLAARRKLIIRARIGELKAFLSSDPKAASELQIMLDVIKRNQTPCNVAI